MLKKVLAAALLAASAGVADAATITSFGAGSAVPSADRTATFDGLAGGTPLLSHSEGGLTFSYEGTQKSWAAGRYYGGSNFSYVSIATEDGLGITGLELDLYTGFGAVEHSVVWETLRGGVVVSSGTTTAVASTFVKDMGTVLGWHDAEGFDTLRVGAAPVTSAYGAFGGFQAIALDNVSVALAGDEVAPVPLPASGLMLLGALGGLVGRRARRAA